MNETAVWRTARWYPESTGRLEGRRQLRDPVGLAAGEAEDVRRRVGRLRAGGDVARLRARACPARPGGSTRRPIRRATTSVPKYRVRGDARPRGSAAVNWRAEREQPERADELGVELGDRHRRGRVERRSAPPCRSARRRGRRGSPAVSGVVRRGRPLAFPPISPCAVTILICGSAHEAVDGRGRGGRGQSAGRSNRQ